MIRPGARTVSNPIERGALVLAAVAAIAAIVEFAWPRPLEATDFRSPDRDPTAGTAVDSSAENPAASQEMARDYDVIAQRPLFTVDRRPYRIPVAEPVVTPPVRRPAPKPEPDVSFQLTAVIRTPSTKIALLTVDGSGESHKLRPGETLEGWTLSEVDEKSVRMQRSGREMLVMLDPQDEAGSSP